MGGKDYVTHAGKFKFMQMLCPGGIEPNYFLFKCDLRIMTFF